MPVKAAQMKSAVLKGFKMSPILIAFASRMFKRRRQSCCISSVHSLTSHLLL